MLNPDILLLFPLIRMVTSLQRHGMKVVSGKISTTVSLDDAKLIWGAAEASNTAVLIEASGPSFAFDYRDWFVEQITFNVMTFELGVVGYQKNLKIKETELIASEGFFS